MTAATTAKHGLEVVPSNLESVMVKGKLDQSYAELDIQLHDVWEKCIFSILTPLPL